MTTPDRHKTAALDAYNQVWRDTKGMSDDSRKVLSFNAAFDAAKAEGASNQQAATAADFARDEAR